MNYLNKDKDSSKKLFLKKILKNCNENHYSILHDYKVFDDIRTLLDNEKGFNSLTLIKTISGNSRLIIKTYFQSCLIYYLPILISKSIFNKYSKTSNQTSASLLVGTWSQVPILLPRFTSHYSQYSV